MQDSTSVHALTNAITGCKYGYLRNENMLQAEARRQAKDWTVGMAAYDLVLAKLANASSQPSADEECAEQGKSKKRKQASSGNEQSSNAAAAMPPAKISKKKKLSSSTEASIGRGDEAAAGQKAAGAAALERSSSPAEGGGAAEQAAAAKASHTARFSRRRAGKNVRRYVLFVTSSR